MALKYSVARYEDLPIMIARLEGTWTSRDLKSMYSACVDLCGPEDGQLIRINDCTRARLSSSESILVIQTVAEQRVAGSFFDTRFNDVLVGNALWVQMIRNRISERLNCPVPLFSKPEAALRYAMSELSQSGGTARA
jgi:hypothetical protein